VVEEFLASLFEGVEGIVELLEEGGRDLTAESGEVGEGGDFSLVVDLKAEEILVQKLHRFGEIYTEERGVVKGKGPRIVIDPIDGSFNFKNGIPYFGLSVFWEEGVSFVTNLSNGDYFLRVRGRRERGNLYRPTRNWFPSRREVVIFEKAYENPEICRRLTENRVKFRSPGALSLSLCYGEEYRGVLFLGQIREFDIAGPYYYNQHLNWYLNREEGILVMSPEREELERLLKIVKG
jgi:myo-inositol-1(or 4)-monophosphatase